LYEEGGETQDRVNQKYGDDVNNYSFNKDKLMNKNRGCTDIICLVIFLAFLGSLGYLTFYAYGKGDLNRILAPVYYDNAG